MKILRKAIAVSVLLVVVGGSAVSASPALKDGQACKKAGQTSTASGMKFTCIKKGAKFVWGKGVAVKARPTASAPATVASAAPATSAVASSIAPRVRITVPPIIVATFV